ncbi:hypothetical protein ACFY7C_16080 [Streptomyces sp. NPDC012769]
MLPRPFPVPLDRGLAVVLAAVAGPAWRGALRLPGWNRRTSQDSRVRS